jgi:uncharacterized membrane protein YcaP (DUF421 family)
MCLHEMKLLDSILGLNVEQLTLIQMAVRAILIFFIAIFLIRVSGTRTLGKHSAFDQLTILIMGSILGRAIVAADQPFFESLCIVALIMILHRALAWITFRSKTAGTIFKGGHIPLMQNHIWQKDNMRRTGITKEDIEETMRQELHAGSIDMNKDIYLERSGKISIVNKDESS